MKTFLFKILLLGFFLFGGYYIWFNHFNYRFSEVAQGKVYKSALIPPDKLEDYLIENNIKTVIDLLHPGLHDRLNPASQDNVNNEQFAIDDINAKYNKSIEHINIASAQVPTEDTLSRFFRVLDDKTKYPVLIHCYHGTGRAEMYSALYNIEYQGMTPDDARSKTRTVVEFLGYKSSFASGRKKGDFLINYVPRNQ